MINASHLISDICLWKRGGKMKIMKIQSSSLLMVFLVFIMALLIHPYQPVDGSQSSVKLENNGYSGLVVSFDEDIPAAKRRDLIRTTQELIKSSSKFLFQVTNRRAYFKSVTLLLPKSWNIGHKWDGNVKKTRSHNEGDADIMIHAEDKVFKNEPITLQFSGCGKPGLRIDLPEKFVTETPEVNGAAKRLVHEWFHYRYGVFDEHGFPGDPLYPTHYSVPGSDRIKISSCASTSTGRLDTNVDIRARNKYGGACNLSVNVDNGFPESKNGICYPVVNLERNMELVSSFMYQEQLSHVRSLCDNSTHNTEAPTKQNLLCERRSIWSVLMEHPDFRHRTNPSKESPMDPDFKILEMDSPRIIFISDIALNRSEDIADLVQRFFQDLPSGSKEVIYDYQSATNTTSGDKKLPVIIGHKVLEHICLQCSISRAMDWLRRDLSEDSESGGDIILITEGRISDPERVLDKVGDQLIRNNLKLKVIVYSNYVGDLSKLQHLVSRVRGKLVIVREELQPNSEITQSTIFKLSNTLESFKPWTSGPFTMIQEEAFTGRNISFEFLIDQSIRDSDSALYVSLMVPNGKKFALTRNSIKLIHNGGTTIYGAQNSLKYMIGLKQTTGFKLESSMIKIGSWKLTYEALEPDNFVAFAVALPRVDKELIKATCWIENVDGGKDAPLLVHVLVKKGYNQYLRDLKVTVKVHNETSGHVVQTAELYDDGNGDPDITKGDGIYSVYVNAPTTVSYYSIKATVMSTRDSNMIAETIDTGPITRDKEHCCGGSSIPADALVEANYVQRVVECGNFFLRENSERYNYFGILSTLRVVKVDQGTRDVVLGFKIPYGDIRLYEFRFFTNEELPLIKTDRFSDVGTLAGLWNYTNSGSSGRYGEVKNIIFSVPYKRRGFYHFAIKTTGYGRIIPYRVSNIVSFYIREDPNYVTTRDPDPTVSITSTAASTREDSLYSWHIIAIIIGSVVVLVLILLLIITCVQCTKRRRGSQRSKFPKVASPVPDKSIKQNLSSVKVNMNMNNQVPSDSIKEPLPEAETTTTLPELSATISPVQSWSADLLLEHYDKVKHAKQMGEAPPVMRVENIGDTVSLSNTSRIRESISDEDNMGPMWQYDGTLQTTHYNPYYPQDWNNSYVTRSHTPSDYDPRYCQRDRKSGSAVSQV